MKNVVHTVLALKYRPKNFKELIGQDIMVETITNSIQLNILMVIKDIMVTDNPSDPCLIF